MSLVSFKSKNHPQQTDLRGALDDVDDRATLPVYMLQFAERFGAFTLDVAAAEHNAKCERYFTKEQDGLAQSWAGEHVWCNPPYSDIYRHAAAREPHRTEVVAESSSSLAAIAPARRWTGGVS